MKLLWNSGKFLAYDMVASLFFIGLYAITKSLPISVGVGIAVGVAQIGWDLHRRRPIEAMQWLSLALVIIGGLSAVIAHDMRIVLMKPSVVYVIVGVTMLKRGWINRYLPPEAQYWVPDLGERWGYVWAGLMFRLGRHQPGGGPDPSVPAMGRGDERLGAGQQDRPVRRPVHHHALDRPAPGAARHGRRRDGADRSHRRLTVQFGSGAPMSVSAFHSPPGVLRQVVT